MNELIEKLHDLLDKQEDINVVLGIERAIDLVKSSAPNVPQEPVVPEFVAEYLNYCIGQEWTLSTALNAYDNKLIGTMHQAAMWLDDTMNQNTFAHAWLFGYEVEKEPLYTVNLPSENDRALAWDEINEAFVVVTRYLTEHRYELTEKEIKRYDERYWSFAVPVEEVAER